MVIDQQLGHAVRSKTCAAEEDMRKTYPIAWVNRQASCREHLCTLRVAPGPTSSPLATKAFRCRATSVPSITFSCTRPVRCDAASGIRRIDECAARRG